MNIQKAEDIVKAYHRMMAHVFAGATREQQSTFHSYMEKYDEVIISSDEATRLHLIQLGRKAYKDESSVLN